MTDKNKWYDGDQEPAGELKLVRHVLGKEVYEDENGVEWLREPDGRLLQVSGIPTKEHLD